MLNRRFNTVYTHLCRKDHLCKVSPFLLLRSITYASFNSSGEAGNISFGTTTVARLMGAKTITEGGSNAALCAATSTGAAGRLMPEFELAEVKDTQQAQDALDLVPHNHHSRDPHGFRSQSLRTVAETVVPATAKPEAG